MARVYGMNQLVLVKFKKYDPDKITVGVISATRDYQSRHFRPDAFMHSYLVSPLAEEGLEHDFDEWFGEDEIKGPF